MADGLRERLLKMATQTPEQASVHQLTKSCHAKSPHAIADPFVAPLPALRQMQQVTC
jgi:hypothetical protein